MRVAPSENVVSIVSRYAFRRTPRVTLPTRFGESDEFVRVTIESNV